MHKKSDPCAERRDHFFFFTQKRFLLGVACKMRVVLSTRTDAEDLHGILFFLTAAHGAGIGDEQTSGVQLNGINARLFEQKRGPSFFPDHGRTAVAALYVQEFWIKTFGLEHFRNCRKQKRTLW